MAVASVAAECSSRSRRAASRTSFIPGFYRALHSQSTAAVNVNERPSRRLRLPQVTETARAEAELPPGFFLVERVIAARKNKVCCT